jgi:uncharacterized protein
MTMEKSKVVPPSPFKAMVPIVKIVGDFCNLRCPYCFYNTRDQATRHVMSYELLEKFLSEFLDIFTGNLRIIWHGGEPLLAGIKYFEKIIELEGRYCKEGQRIWNGVQTNGTLINDEWAAFFKEHNFNVGISLDGAPESHNRFRIFPNGKGSFDKVMQGIEALRRHGVRFGVLQVITRANLPRFKDDFEFFVNVLGIKNWGINEFLDISTLNKAMASQSISNEELTALFKTCIDLWLASGDEEIKIDEIDNFLCGVLGKRAISCTFNGTCTGYFCVEYDGKVYPCDRFSINPDFLFGDLTSQSLLEILTGPARLKYISEVNSLHPDCAGCEWRFACHNGCSAHRIGGPGGKYYYCETRKAIFEYLRDKVNQYKNQRKEVRP